MTSLSITVPIEKRVLTYIPVALLRLAQTVLWADYSVAVTMYFALRHRVMSECVWHSPMRFLRPSQVEELGLCSHSFIHSLRLAFRAFKSSS